MTSQFALWISFPGYIMVLKTYVKLLYIVSMLLKEPAVGSLFETNLAHTSIKLI